MLGMDRPDLAMTCADENGGRVTGFASNDIQHPVHTVGKVDIPAPRRTEHRGIPRCFTPAGVRAQVLEAVIRFHLSYYRNHLIFSYSTNQKFAEQISGHYFARPGEENGGHYFRSGPGPNERSQMGYFLSHSTRRIMAENACKLYIIPADPAENLPNF